MKKYNDLFTSVVEKADPSTMKEFAKILEEHFCELEIEQPDMYWPVIHKMHILINGPHFSKEYAEYAVGQMKNQDETIGGHWTEMETTDLATKFEVVFDRFNIFDWYYVLNMLYSDHSKTFEDDLEAYVSFAEEWLGDVDAPEGKAYLYYQAMCV